MKTIAQVGVTTLVIIALLFSCKKADYAALINAMVDKTIPQLEKVFSHYDGLGKLKVGERSNFKSACSLLNYCYDKKKDKTKAEFYQKKYDEADKAHQ